MKRILASLVALIAIIGAVNAQSWNMVVTQKDGSTHMFNADDVKEVTFKLKDQNVDQVIIKELYTTGVPNENNPKKPFAMDKGFILYNNSSETAVINNLAIGMLDPYNAHSIQQPWYQGNATEPSYAQDEWVPATDGIWYFPNTLVIEPYSQVVVSCMGAIDNTKTYAQSVNYANKDYYTMYDPNTGYNNTKYYPTPSEVIPTNHYLKAVKLGMSTAWALSQSSPAFFIFQTEGTTPEAFAQDQANITYEPGKEAQAVARVLKVPTAWIIDGVEVYQNTMVLNSKKRFTAEVDAGHVEQAIRIGHSVYRNVDAEETKKIAGNETKLVYNYQYGKDPSGIDAEASMKKGAKIVYMDSNNSSQDFHERSQFSLRDK